ncbi:MAG: energy transducer TonB [Bacteroidetes bacterium]|nr:energy transducer TonB [Bacteroidota bacterium]
MQNKKDKTRGIIGTIIYHALLLLLLIFLGLTTPLPLPGEEGVEVNIGNSEMGSGVIQQPIPEEAPPTPVPEEVTEEEIIEEIPEEIPEEKPPDPIIEEEVIQQEIEEAPQIIKPEEIKKEEPKKEIKPMEEKPVEKVVEKKPDPVVNPNALYQRKNTNAQGSNQGITHSQGDQGEVHGTPESVNYEGLGGEGEEISYSLAGRGAKHLPKPSYNSPEQGRVVVSIWVDRQGNVIRADAGAKGTNISDLNLRRLAREAALRAKFSEDPSATDLQKGTITYNFIRLN